VKRSLPISLIFLLLCTPISGALAGPYPPAAGVTGSHAVHKDDPAFLSWAASYTDYIVGILGERVDDTWQAPEQALGKAEGNSFDVVSLGAGGSIDLVFDPPISNGDGWDFAVFENAVTDTFLELAYVEVSSDGENFLWFESRSLVSGAVGSFDNIDPTEIDGLAGKYRQGYGTPFDLSDLAETPEVIAGDVDLAAITHVRIVDIVGDGSFLDSMGTPIYDPFPTVGSVGFDLDAVGVSNGAPYPEGEYTPPEIPSESGEAGFGDARGCFVNTIAGR
jgi:hypothetical protein